MKQVLLDSNVYDRIAKDAKTRSSLASLMAQGKIEVIVTPVIEDELRSSPFGGIPPWFPVKMVPELFVFEFARFGWAEFGSGEFAQSHCGKSKKIRDAIIADSAHSKADIFVSEDKRCRNRLIQSSKGCTVLSYSQFRRWITSVGQGP